MVTDPATASRQTRWTISRLESVPYAPLWAWAVISSVWMTCYCLYAHIVVGADLGSGEFWQGWGLTNIQDALLIGYLPAATLWGQRRAARTLHALRPALECTAAEFDDAREALHDFGRRRSILIVAIALAIGLSIGGYNILRLSADPGLTAGLLERLGFAGERASHVIQRIAAWETLNLTVVAPLLGLFVYLEAAVSDRISAVAERHARIDLIDLTPLKALTDQGLGSAVRVIGVAVIASIGLLVVLEDLMVVAALIAAPIFGAVALFWPVRGARRRIARKRDRELARVRTEIRDALDGRASSADGRLADLLAYETRLEAVQPSLFDRTALLRFGIIVGTGMSMIGGALVERVVGVILDR